MYFLATLRIDAFIVVDSVVDVLWWTENNVIWLPRRPALHGETQEMTATKTCLGVLTPSSNTALEPLTSALAASAGRCSAHFSRFTVTEISLAQAALNQFDDSKILAAAELLADAKVDVIGWSGTAAGWRGFECDRQLCERIEQRTGIKATTAILALNELMQKLSVKKLAIVSPYTADVQQCIVNNYRAAGVETTAHRHLNISVNHRFALVEPEQLLGLIEEVIEEGAPDAVVTYCTNLHAAQLADQVERRWNVPLLDTVSTTVWGMLRAAGRSPADIKGWGRLFEAA